MKTFFSGLMPIVLSIISLPAISAAACTFQNNSELVSELVTGLPKGIWETNGNSSVLYALHFYEEGTVDWFEFLPSGEMKFKTFNWLVVPSGNNMPKLWMSNQCEAFTFSIEAACHTLGLKALEQGLSLQLQRAEAMPIDAKKQKLDLVTGNWENTLYPIKVKTALPQQDIENAYLKYEFKEDGILIRKLVNRTFSIKDKGSWSISRDGKHIIMRMDEGKVAVASLKYVNMDELVLTHLLFCDNDRFATDTKDFYFNRQ